MRGNGITFEEVVMAANHLQSQGQNPTIEKIRLQLGSGSNTTINKYLNAWREQQQAFTEKEESDWPSDIVKMAAEQAWTSIRKEADRKIATIKEESAAFILDAENQLRAAQENEQRAIAELSALREEYHVESGAKELLSLDFKKVQQEFKLLSAHCEALELRLSEREQLFNKNSEDNTVAHAKEMKLLEDKYALQEKNHQTLINELKIHSETIRHEQMFAHDQAKEEIKKLSKNLSSVNEKLNQKDMQLAEAKSQLKTCLRERDESQNLFTKLANQFHVLNERSLMVNEILSSMMKSDDIERRFDHLEKKMVQGISTMLRKLEKKNSHSK